MEFENILKLIECVSNSSLTSFTLEEGDTKIILEANRGTVIPVTVTTNAEGNLLQNGGIQTLNTAVVQSNDESKAATSNTNVKGNVVKSPLVGVFYSSPSPDAESFVKVGDRVTVGQTLGIVEAMKLMNEIECDFDGVVKEILIHNSDVVEYGQPLFVIE